MVDLLVAMTQHGEPRRREHQLLLRGVEQRRRDLTVTDKRDELSVEELDARLRVEVVHANLLVLGDAHDLLLQHVQMYPQDGALVAA